MSLAGLPEVEEVFRFAEKHPLLPEAQRSAAPVLDRQALERLLPHRGGGLLLDSVTHLDQQAFVIAARYTLRHDDPVFAGHFPGFPVWPGVLQVEAIGQAGVVLRVYGARPLSTADTDCGFTDILAARFLRLVLPEGEVEIMARSLEDGLFRVTVGQCLSRGEVCSVAALRGLGRGIDS